MYTALTILKASRKILEAGFQMALDGEAFLKILLSADFCLLYFLYLYILFKSQSLMKALRYVAFSLSKDE